jgi:hypothetical protein
MSARPPVTDWTSDFDHLDPARVEDPHPIWDDLRRTCPIAHTDRFGGCLFSITVQGHSGGRIRHRAFFVTSQHRARRGTDQDRRAATKQWSSVRLHSPIRLAHSADQHRAQVRSTESERAPISTARDGISQQSVLARLQLLIANTVARFAHAANIFLNLLIIVLGSMIKEFLAGSAACAEAMYPMPVAAEDDPDFCSPAPSKFDGGLPSPKPTLTLISGGYYEGEELRACEDVGITVTLPKPLTSGAKAAGRFGKQDFVYVAAEDTYRCPAGERPTYRFTN